MTLNQDNGNGGLDYLNIKQRRFRANVLAKSKDISELISIIDKSTEYEMWNTDDDEEMSNEIIPISRLFMEKDLEYFNGIYAECYAEENKDFYKRLDSLSMDDISKITIEQQRAYHGGDLWSHSQSYDCANGKLEYEKYVEPPEDEG